MEAGRPGRRPTRAFRGEVIEAWTRREQWRI